MTNPQNVTQVRVWLKVVGVSGHFIFFFISPTATASKTLGKGQLLSNVRNSCVWFDFNCVVLSTIKVKI